MSFDKHTVELVVSRLTPIGVVQRDIHSLKEQPSGISLHHLGACMLDFDERNGE